MKQTNKWK